MSRIARREFWLDDSAKEVFVRMLQKQAAFAGVEVLTYCVLGNHFHLLLRVPPSPWRADGNHAMTDNELLARYEKYYGAIVPQSTYSLEELRAILAAGGGEANEARQKVMARMGDLAAFMRELKQRFAFWFNRKFENDGTIWSARFKSLLVENSAEVLSTVAAYIDLNPIRARLVSDPAEHRWSGYAAAMAGSGSERLGLCRIFGESVKTFDGVIAAYRLILFGKGLETKRGENDAGKLEPALAESVLKSAGKVSLAEAFRCRVRFFGGARALGSERFLDDCCEAMKALGGPLKRRRGLVDFYRLDWDALKDEDGTLGANG